MVKNPKEWPDLILLDGGIAHLSIINKLIGFGFENKFKVAALAKRESYTLKMKMNMPLIGRVELSLLVMKLIDSLIHSIQREGIRLLSEILWKQLKDWSKNTIFVKIFWR